MIFPRPAGLRKALVFFLHDSGLENRSATFFWNLLKKMFDFSLIFFRHRVIISKMVSGDVSRKGNFIRIDKL